ncbi:MAG TPA: cyclopropane-fatty-acyl-phospholipid synthase family protein [Gemmatimonadaceae bacterium]|nr:cyclopropane-fatty-acyl-phospholipid synthase family protein [Gemmatimonadaceae bacterium]
MRKASMSADREHLPTSGTTPDRAHRSEDAVLEQAREAIRLLFGPPASRSCAVRYWDGSEERPAAQGALSTQQGAAARPSFTLVIRSAGGLRRMLTPPSELRFGEAYVRGDVDIEGDMEAAAGLAQQLRERVGTPREIAHIVACASRIPHDDDLGTQEPHGRREHLHFMGHKHSRERDREAVRSHYDVGNDFYSLWLDRSLVYSCAYFPTGSEDIDAAQRAKLDHLCRKLRLSPGERLLDIGCGWGGLIRYAAANYGVEALGITLSERQAALARERIRADGLEHRCRVEVRDYRDFPPDTTFDKVVSVGMFEHVGRAELPTYFRQAARLTKPGGLFLNHGIVRARDHDEGWRRWLRRMLWREGKFIDRYVFPDGELVPLDEAVRNAEGAGLETRDVETLRDHYALTLRQWVRRLESARDAAEKLVGAQAYRVWRLYMAASAHAFASGKLSLAQVLLGRPDEHGRVEIPRTRADIYDVSASAQHAAA